MHSNPAFQAFVERVNREGGQVKDARTVYTDAGAITCALELSHEQGKPVALRIAGPRALVLLIANAKEAVVRFTARYIVGESVGSLLGADSVDLDGQTVRGGEVNEALVALGWEKIVFRIEKLWSCYPNPSRDTELVEIYTMSPAEVAPPAPEDFARNEKRFRVVNLRSLIRPNQDAIASLATLALLQKLGSVHSEPPEDSADEDEALKEEEEDRWVKL